MLTNLLIQTESLWNPGAHGHLHLMSKSYLSLIYPNQILSFPQSYFSSRLLHYINGNCVSQNLKSSWLFSFSHTPHLIHWQIQLTLPWKYIQNFTIFTTTATATIQCSDHRYLSPGFLPNPSTLSFCFHPCSSIFYTYTRVILLKYVRLCHPLAKSLSRTRYPTQNKIQNPYSGWWVSI